MCGICGIFNFNGSNANRDTVVDMNNRMIHRGPDDDGYYFEGEIGLGMRRLSIIDLEKGRQPISNEDGRYTVIQNGEIYNYTELKNDLVKRGHSLKTNSDTETIVHLFEEKGVDCVAELNGMFAIAIWDNAKKELFLFRDRMGVKPLFYAVTAESFLFSSDLSSLTGGLKTKNDINYNAFLSYIGMSYVSYPETIFKNINKLEPGYFLKISAAYKVEKKRYWDVNDFATQKSLSIEEYKEQTLAALRDSIRIQLRSDVPVGTFLSGGIDSSAIVALLSEQIDQPVRTFSAGFENGLNELPYARIVANKFKTNHTELTISGNELPSILPEIIDKMDEPVSDNSIIPTFMLSKLAIENGIKVILNGTGGDELFGGYDRYLPQNQPWKMINSLSLNMRKLGGSLFKYKDFNKGTQIANPELYFASSISGVNFAIARSLFKNEKDYQSLISNVIAGYKKFVPYSYKDTNKSRLMYCDLKDYLVNDVLALLDKMAMAVSLEGRVPLLDHRVVEMCFRIPDSIKFKNGTLKWLLKNTLKDILPPEIHNLPKAGFAGPTWFWVNNLLKDSMRKCLVNNPITFFKENLNISVLKEALDNAKLTRLYSETLFSLYIFSLWYKRHVDGEEIVI